MVKVIAGKKMTEDSKNNFGSLPLGKKHRPIVFVDYKKIDSDSGYGDALYMDIGQSTWNKEDFSVKIWRRTDDGQRWSRQSEELPLSWVLDLAALVVAVATGGNSVLQEFLQNSVQNSDQKEALPNFLTENM